MITILTTVTRQSTSEPWLFDANPQWYQEWLVYLNNTYITPGLITWGNRTFSNDNLSASTVVTFADEQVLSTYQADPKQQEYVVNRTTYYNQHGMKSFYERLA